jgi:uncharacterized protein (TIGR00251 family)
MKITETKEGLILEIFAKLRSKEFKIAVEADEIVVFCREEPFHGKVNSEIIREFSKLFHKKVELVSGFSSKQKRLLIRDVKKSDVESVLLPK